MVNPNQDHQIIFLKAWRCHHGSNNQNESLVNEDSPCRRQACWAKKTLKPCPAPQPLVDGHVGRGVAGGMKKVNPLNLLRGSCFILKGSKLRRGIFHVNSGQTFGIYTLRECFQALPLKMGGSYLAQVKNFHQKS